MPCDTADNRGSYFQSKAKKVRRCSVNLAFVANSILDRDCNRNNYPTGTALLNDRLGTGQVVAGQNDFSLADIIGTGGFGSVFLGRYCGRRVAVKSVRSHSKHKEAGRQSFRAEFNALLLRHENIVSVLATTAYENFDTGAFIIMEYAGRRNLQQVINESCDSLTPTRRTKYARHIIRGLRYTHAQGIAHLDVKPANVMVDDNDVCRLIDFGCSQRLRDEEQTDICSTESRSCLTGTFSYRAPELLRGNTPTAKADIYSYGITLWQILTRETPFAGKNQHVVIFGVVAHNLRPTLPPETNDNDAWYERLVTSCWDGCVAKRPSSAEILSIMENRSATQDLSQT